VAVIRYLVNDVDVALEFYIDMLGFELVEKWGPPFAMVKRGDLALWLSGPGSSASRPLSNGSKPAPGGWNRLVLETDDLASLVEKLKRSGAQLRSDIVSGPGGKQVLVDDPRAIQSNCSNQAASEYLKKHRERRICVET
jgi:catechol 2,3-dioxygenase-like lactoylglutathione lyase family enzyme